MRKSWIIILFLLSLVACSPKEGSESYDPGLLSTVPSDAVAIASYDRCQEALGALLDSTNVLRTIDFRKLNSEPAVLSLVYISKLSPLLAIDTGKADSEEQEDLQYILSQAKEKHLHSAVVPHEGRRILLLAISDTVLPLAKRHLEIGASILDAPGFGKVAPAASRSGAVLMFRNSAAKWLLSGGILQTLGLQDMESSLSRKALTSFLPGVCDWTLIDMEHGSMVISHEDSPRSIDVLVRQTPETSSTIPVPEGCSFLLEVSAEEGFREAYGNWLDSGSKLESYLKTLKELKKESGKDPLDWEKELAVREVARIRWNSHEVAVLATGRKPAHDISVPAENPYRSFINTLYFHLNTCDSHYSRVGNLAVFGTAEDVAAYMLDMNKTVKKGKISFRLVSGDITITADRQTTKLMKN